FVLSKISLSLLKIRNSRMRPVTNSITIIIRYKATLGANFFKKGSNVSLLVKMSVAVPLSCTNHKKIAPNRYVIIMKIYYRLNQKVKYNRFSDEIICFSY